MRMHPVDRVPVVGQHEAVNQRRLVVARTVCAFDHLGTELVFLHRGRGLSRPRDGGNETRA